MNICVTYENDSIENHIKEEIEYIENITLNILNKALEIENIHGDFELSLSFVSKETIKNLNSEYRDKDSVTDVLSFPMIEFKNRKIQNEDTEEFLGDVVISFDRVIEQSLDYGHSIEREVIYLICHSIFHLFGYDHLSIEDKEIMRAKEKELMSKIRVYKNQ